MRGQRPSFTKTTRDQYLEAGRKELQNGDFYQEVANDPSNDIKKSNDALAQHMMSKGEICQNVAEFLENGDKKLPNFYHLLRTHKISPGIDDPRQWIDVQGYPIRGIISGRGDPQKD